jgi:nitrate reductase (NAD(P)H)
MDATDEFNSIHSSKAKAMLAKYYIGDLVDSKPEAEAPATPEAAENGHANGHGDGHTNGVANGKVNGVANGAVNGKVNGVANGHSDLVALNPREKIAFSLAERIELSHNVRLFRFALQSPQHRFGLPVGKHVFLYANINGENVMRWVAGCAGVHGCVCRAVECCACTGSWLAAQPHCCHGQACCQQHATRATCATCHPHC